MKAWNERTNEWSKVQHFNFSNRLFFYYITETKEIFQLFECYQAKVHNAVIFSLAVFQSLVVGHFSSFIMNHKQYLFPNVVLPKICNRTMSTSVKTLSSLFLLSAYFGGEIVESRNYVRYSTWKTSRENFSFHMRGLELSRLNDFK